MIILKVKNYIFKKFVQKIINSINKKKHFIMFVCKKRFFFISLSDPFPFSIDRFFLNEIIFHENFFRAQKCFSFIKLMPIYIRNKENEKRIVKTKIAL